MLQRRYTSSSASGRPSGTDGSDFSYRMVVDSRYTKVTQGKARLFALLLSQAVLQIIEVLYQFLSTSKHGDFNKLALLFAALGFFSLIIGEFGRRRSRVSFLKVYMAASSIAILLWIAFVIKNKSLLQVVQDLNGWPAKKFEFLEIGLVLLGSVVQIFTISTIISLISNMSPPKRTS